MAHALLRKEDPNPRIDSMLRRISLKPASHMIYSRAVLSADIKFFLFKTLKSIHSVLKKNRENTKGKIG